MKIDPLLLPNQSQESEKVLKASPWIMRWMKGQSLNSHKREDKYQYNYITLYTTITIFSVLTHSASFLVN
jgi:hypothetical protein